MISALFWYWCVTRDSCCLGICGSLTAWEFQAELLVKERVPAWLGLPHAP